MKKIIILHGWTYTKNNWNQLVNMLQDKGIESQLLDVPGLATVINRPWKLEDYVEWLRQLVLKQSPPVILLGHSNGGRIAIAFTANYPHLVQHLILVDSAGVLHNQWYLKLKRSVFGAVAKLGKRITSSDDWRRLLYKIIGEQDYYLASPVLRQTMADLIARDLTMTLTKITTATTIVWGEKDQITPLSDGQLMRQLIPHSSLHIIKGAGHSAHISHPQQLCHIITSKVFPA